MHPIRLGVNIDHVATIRNARGGVHPDPVQAAIVAAAAGADGITAHLREDRRHISDDDITRLKAEIDLPLNLEMAATEEMVEIALRTQPNAACIVPENRAEITTEGGLDVIKGREKLESYVVRLKNEGIRVSLFIEPSLEQIEAAKTIGADIVELHTGNYCHQTGDARQRELAKIKTAAEYSDKIGLECHAGHGLTYETVPDIAAFPQIIELNIGHFLIGEAIFMGLDAAIHKMQDVIGQAWPRRYANDEGNS